VLEALAGAGGAGAAHARSGAIRYLRRQQDADGGFPAMPGAGSNAQSTAFAVQGLVAAGVDPGTLRRRGASPLDYLRGLIAPDGHVRYSRSADQTPVWVTAEALLALDAKPLPLAPVARRAAPPVRHAVPPATAPTHHAATAAAAHGPRHSAPATTRHHAAAALPPTVARATSDPRLDRLASDVGILTALWLAPLGQD
jgi:hypothetical protein